MATWLILAWFAVVAVAAVAVVVVPPRRMALRKRVMVNLTDGKAVAGVLWSRRRGLLVLKDATLHVAGSEPTPVDGEILVERARVDFVQVL